MHHPSLTHFRDEAQDVDWPFATHTAQKGTLRKCWDCCTRHCESICSLCV